MIRWTANAAEDVLGITDWMRASRPQLAGRVTGSIVSTVAGLDDRPQSGPPGRVPGTREITVPQLPYLVVYALEQGGDVTVLRILHGMTR